MRLFILALLLASCSQKGDWNVSYLSTGDKEFDSAKLILTTRDRVHGMDIEFVQTAIGLRTYLQVHSHPVPKDPVVTAKTDTELVSAAAIRREGGQKILLPQEIQDFLLSSLKEGKSVTIEFSGYKTMLNADGFKDQLEKMENPPLNLPVRLPF